MYQALDKKGRKINMTLQIDSLPAAEVTKPAYPLREVQHADKTLSYLHNASIRRKIDSTYSILDGKTLAEVVVQGKKVKQSPAEFDGVNRLYGQADDVLIIDEKFPPASNIYDMMAGRLAGVQVVRDGEQQNSYNVKIRNSTSFKSSTQPLYLLDGLPMEDPDGNALMSISPQDVARIEILKGASASMYGVRGGNGVIAIYTRKGGSRPQGPSTVGLKSFVLTGFQYPREFYSPVYDVEKNENIKPDHRATLYWNPLLFTDEQGKAKISFFNSDYANSMQVLIEGISASGKPFVYQLLIGRKK
jgi:TonB-dependent SusC/RagA subfamily outer membrane receptor